MTLSNKAMHIRNTFRLRGQGSDLLSLALSGQKSKMRISSQRDSSICFDCEFTSAEKISIGLCSYDGEFQSFREADSGHFHIVLPTRGQATFKSQGKSYDSFPGQAFVSEGGPGDLGSVDGEREHYSLLLCRDDLAARLSAMLDKPTTTRLSFDPIFDIDTGPGQFLLTLVQTTFKALSYVDTPRHSPIYVRNLTEAIANLVLESMPHRFSADLESGAASISPRHVKRAIDFMKANISRAITMQEIAGSCDVSVRSLQKGFQDFHMTTPMTYLSHLRFEAVHKGLQQAGPGETVASVAGKWGFGHLGRFSTDYKRRFGQSPSETLRSWANQSGSD